MTPACPHHATRLLHHITSHPKANSSHFNKTHCPVVNNASLFLHLECRSGDPNILPDMLVPLLSCHVPNIVHWVCEWLAGCVKWSEVKWRCYGIRQWRCTCAVTSDAASFFASKSYEAGSVTFLQRGTTVSTDSWRVLSGTVATIKCWSKSRTKQPSLALAVIWACMAPTDILVVQFPDDEKTGGSRNVGFLAVETLWAVARRRKLYWIQSRGKKARGTSFHISPQFSVHSYSHILHSTNWAIDKLSSNSALPSARRLLPLTCWTVCCGLPL